MKNIPKGWSLCTIDELAGGGGLVTDGDWVESKDQDPNGNVRLIQLADIGDGVFLNRSRRFMTDEKAKKLQCTFLETGDLLIARMPDPLGRACLFPGVGKKSVTAVDVFIWRPGDNAAEPSWLMYAVNSPEIRARIANLASGTTRQRVSGRNLKRLSLPTPPKSIQKRIVIKLDSLRARSQSAREEVTCIPKLVERYKQAVLAAAFRGSLTADWRAAHPEREPVRSLVSARFAAVNDRTKKSGFGRDERSAIIERDGDLRRELIERAAEEPLPDTWEWCGLGEAFGVYVGATPSRKDPSFWQGDVSWVSSGEVAFCRISETEEKITAKGLANTSTRLHPAGTVLLGMIGEGKTRGQAAILDIEACNNQNCAAIRVSEATYPPEYVYWYLYAVYEQTRAAGGGNNQPALNKDKVQRLAIPLAPPNEAAAVVKAIEAHLEPLRRLELEVASGEKLLDQLGNKILAKAFRGELVPQDPTDEAASVLLEHVPPARLEGSKQKLSRRRAG